MKKRLHSKLSATILALVMLCTLLPTAVFAAGDVAINETNFPDEIFRKYVRQFDTDKDGTLSTAELGAVTAIYVGGVGVSSLKGIEYFTELEGLDCSGDRPTIAAGNNTELKYPGSSDNNLTELDVSKNTKLIYLDCSDNNLTSLDVSKCTKLEELDCSSNALTAFDVSKNIALTRLHCSINNLTSLDVSKNTALEELRCGDNNLTSLDVRNNLALTWLTCYDNKLTSLDISNNTALKYLSCDGNSLTSLDVSKCTALTYLSCDGNKLTSLDVSKNPALTDLSCSDNSLTSLDVSKNTALTYLSCDDNVTLITTKTDGDVAINAINFPNTIFCDYVKQFDKDNNGTLSVSERGAVTAIDVSGKAISSLKGIEYFTALTTLTCYDNNLTSLDVSKNIALTYLSCDGNKLTSLDISNNTALRYLSCYDNSLTELDVSKNTALTYLDCCGNGLTSLDVSRNTKLGYLECDDNVTLITTRDKIFTDVKPGDYYYDAVVWAVDKGVTTGTSATTFSPDMVCTRAQIVTFLWRMAGSPKANAENPFTDVNPGAYYYDAVTWAVEKGITIGTSATTFSPDMVCTRAHIVTFLWRAAGSPEETSANPFTDVNADAYCYDAVLWAVANGITTGTSATTFSPDLGCTRAQAVTFIYRANDAK